METQAALVIAQVLGPFYLIAGISLATAPERAARLIDDMATNTAHTFLWGFIALGLGLLVLAFHHAWTADWRVLVTLIGWLATVKGALLILAPAMMIRFTARLFASPGRLRAWAAGPIVLGVFLAAMGYGVA